MTSRKLFALCIGLFLVGASLNNEDYREITDFPAPAPNAFAVVGANLPDGGLVLWNGDALYLQNRPGGDAFTEIATGYAGDPGFIAMAPDGHTALLGAGFSPALYLFDTDAPVDFVEGTQIAAPNHFSGAFLTANLVILDRSKDDFSGSELVIFDLSGAKSLDDSVPVLSLPPNPGLKQQIVDKPAFSYASAINVDPSGTILYVMDANARELRTFSVAALIMAHEREIALDWESNGTPVGAPGDFYSGGVAGFTPEGYLVIAGSEGFGLPGGIQLVDPTPPATVVATLDPEGTQPFYSAIYNAVTDEIIATTGAQVTYATEGGIGSPALSCRPQ